MRNVPGNMRAAHFINMIEDPLPGLMLQVRHWITSKEYTLLDGRMDVSRGLTDFSAPLLAFYAAVDPFINAARALEFFNGIKIKDKRAMVCSKEEGYVENYNHCDLAFGREAANEIFEPVHKWLKGHPCPSPTGKRKSPPASPEGRSLVARETAMPPSEMAAPLETKSDASAPSQTKPKASAKPKAKPKVTGKKQPVKTAKPSASKADATVKTVAVPGKTSVARAPIAKKAAAVPGRNVTAKQGAADDGLEISPEALARAASILAARNQTLSEIDSLLDKGTKKGGK